MIQDRYPEAYRKVEGEKTYFKCMAMLAPGQRRGLIAPLVAKAKPNPAHLCIALLVKEGYVDRMLTTNFDPLIIKACAAFDEFPGIYDLANARCFVDADVAGNAVYCLHGQHTGFILINTPEEFEEHSQFVAPAFHDAGRKRVWIVVGYSGKNDPVFEQLASIPRLDYGLYWIGYNSGEPPTHVRERLLASQRYALYVNSPGADAFFADLVRELEIIPPEWYYPRKWQ